MSDVKLNAKLRFDRRAWSAVAGRGSRDRSAGAGGIAIDPGQSDPARRRRTTSVLIGMFGRLAIPVGKTEQIVVPKRGGSARRPGGSRGRRRKGGPAGEPLRPHGRGPRRQDRNPLRPEVGEKVVLLRRSQTVAAAAEGMKPSEGFCMSQHEEHHWLSRIVEVFLRGNLSVLLIVISLIAGGVALLVTPREEEPQIVVPMADVLVQMPGASAEEVEQQVSTRLERLLYQIDGVEYVYSMSRPGSAIVTVRFYVGEDREASLVKLYNKIAMNIDIVPPGVTGWVVKPMEIDDVPIVDVTLWSEQYDDFVLRRVAEQVEVALQSVPDTAPHRSRRRAAAADLASGSTPRAWPRTS